METRVLQGLEPSRVFYYFEEICRIPHGSGNTEAIGDYLLSFARKAGLPAERDERGNVLIRKAASPGHEDSPVLILQGHMDMVCEKLPDVVHDFDKDPLKLSVREDQIYAAGTTLGGDDGIAVAYALAILEDDSLVHPPLEVLITVDEEVGMLGANALDCSCLTGRRLLNLDSEEEGILLTGCAGGGAAVSDIPVQWDKARGEIITLNISGLAGGHSGEEIDKKRANANILMGKLLYRLEQEFAIALSELKGGEKDNAITRECRCTFVARPEEREAIFAAVHAANKDFRFEYLGSDEGIVLEASSLGEGERDVLSLTSQEKVLFFLMQMPYGVAKMSGSIKGLVQTSSNPGIVLLEKEAFHAVNLVRSSVKSAKEDLLNRIAYLTEFLGGIYNLEGDYPAWEYRKDSPLRDTMVRVFREVYGKEPKVAAIHAGLECGLFYQKIDNLDCVSIGPNIYDIHTPAEHLSVSSTKRVWDYLLKVLEALA